jgi:hypothetical protein
MASRVKGGVSLAVFVRGADGEPQVRQDGVYFPGERIQFAYSCDHRNRLVLLSIDEEGRMTTYYPAEGDSAVVVQQGQDLPLPNSIELDSYVGRELYVAFFSVRPVMAETVRGEVRERFSEAGTLDSLRLEPDGDAVARTVMITKKERQP